MTKDDYFVLVYRILAYLYYCVKEGFKPDMTYKAREDAEKKYFGEYRRCEEVGVV